MEYGVWTHAPPRRAADILAKSIHLDTHRPFPEVRCLWLLRTSSQAKRPTCANQGPADQVAVLDTPSTIGTRSCTPALSRLMLMIRTFNEAQLVYPRQSGNQVLSGLSISGAASKFSPIPRLLGHSLPSKAASAPLRKVSQRTGHRGSYVVFRRRPVCPCKTLINTASLTLASRPGHAMILLPGLLPLISRTSRRCQAASGSIHASKRAFSRKKVPLQPASPISNSQDREATLQTFLIDKAAV
ncbi:uncharacterized protein BDZ83DRAFT_406666 [Colletotrichum acutatum]|uniref:Uncharacterized protein n=1 Tax=Glomerella acutata TaxID=27357 RepID=A0AAD8XFM8_GLOAC|nr:uncharacterized protein BDZ83DRAFT_406666 [Colletotrichum acutatum]KAK1722998.1 hypothetical protein BDZ83DRAFT_406666 [Colletotrichum acutatum]